MPDEQRVKVPGYISWAALWGGVVLMVTATWWQRGSVAAQDSVRETTMEIVRKQADYDARLTEIEQSIKEQRVEMRWIIEAIRRDEYRKGYVPPPAPSPSP